MNRDVGHTVAVLRRGVAVSANALRRNDNQASGSVFDGASWCCRVAVVAVFRKPLKTLDVGASWCAA